MNYYWQTEVIGKSIQFAWFKHFIFLQLYQSIQKSASVFHADSGVSIQNA